MANREQKRFGWFLEDKGLITGHELSAALAEQFNMKHLTSIEQYSYPKELLSLITLRRHLNSICFLCARKAAIFCWQ
jgi:GSPII_E N-terminal domain.